MDEDELVTRLRRLEAQVQTLSERAGVLWPAEGRDGISDEVRRLARAGKKIEAIKLHRQHTGLGLAEAKEVVDRL